MASEFQHQVTTAIVKRGTQVNPYRCQTVIANVL